MAKKQHLSKLETRNDQVAPAETSEILHLASECLKVQGDFIELGCYRGDTSVLLGKTPSRPRFLHPPAQAPLDL